MSKDAQFILAWLLGFSALGLVFTYSDRQESAQKIENMKTLYELKANLQAVENIQQTKLMIEDTQKAIDSLNNIK
jgi:hypothetical protein